MWSRVLANIVAVGLAAACSRGASAPSPTPFALEPAGTTFQQIDADGDQKLALEALHRGLGVHYYYRLGLDLDGDRIVDHVELTTAFFELWDTDDDGAIAPEEWKRGIDVWFPDRSAITNFDDWDLDHDRVLGIIELGEGTLRPEIYDTYDANQDGIIQTREVSRYLHAQWDTNDDGFVDLAEWPLP